MFGWSLFLPSRPPGFFPAIRRLRFLLFAGSAGRQCVFGWSVFFPAHPLGFFPAGYGLQYLCISLLPHLNILSCCRSCAAGAGSHRFPGSSLWVLSWQSKKVSPPAEKNTAVRLGSLCVASCTRVQKPFQKSNFLKIFCNLIFA